MTQQAKISLMILSLVNSGIDIKVAIDQVLGDGTSDRIASEIYQNLRK